MADNGKKMTAKSFRDWLSETKNISSDEGISNELMNKYLQQYLQEKNGKFIN